MRPALLAAACLLSTIVRAGALVTVDVTPLQTTPLAEGAERRVQSVSLSNELANYTLTYDIDTVAGKPDEVTSHWWAWTIQYVTLGLTEPTNANWYFQGFFNWYFDGESLYNRPATMEVLRAGGTDGLVQYTWDTPTVTARIRFGLTTGSDKLLMFADYTPKTAIKVSRLRLNCYPTGFAQPRQRAVTTAQGTRRTGDVVDLDLAAERWVLYEDTTEGRSGDGSAGLLVGTPSAFAKIHIPVGEYGITTDLTLKPEARSFALALYSFPTLPDYQATRDYFQAGGDAEAAWLGHQAGREAGGPLPAWKLPEQRREALREWTARLFDRPSERWRKLNEPLEFDWSAKLPGGPIRTKLFVARWAAWETMALADRLDMAVDHVYFDRADDLAGSRNWPYASYTGIGSVGRGPATTRALQLLDDDAAELYLLPCIDPNAIPPTVLARLLERVAEGKGLLLTGPSSRLAHWPKELLAEPDAGLAKQVLASFESWSHVPGWEPGEDGQPPIEGYRYGQGRVIAIRRDFGTYAAFCPRNKATEGLDGAMDRSLAIAARAAVVAAGRPSLAGDLPGQPDATMLSIKVPPQAATWVVRRQDTYGRVMSLQAYQGPLFPAPIGVLLYLGSDPVFQDWKWLDAEGRTIGNASAFADGNMLRGGDLKMANDVRLRVADLTPCEVAAPPAPATVPLQEGGTLTAEVVIENLLDGPWQLKAEVMDAAGRILARSRQPATERMTISLALPRPVRVCHALEVSLVGEPALELAFTRIPFTIPLPYPYDDFTALLWTYTGGDPILRRTTAMGYQLGADMQDLSHMGGADDTRAAREYAVAARSGLRLVPYVTRIYGEGDASKQRRPGLFETAVNARTEASLAANARQARPYAPAAFTLGDENYLNNSPYEIGWRPDTIAAYQAWLTARYGAIDTLNEAWGSGYAGFGEVQPVTLRDGAASTVSYAPWLELQTFLTESFVGLHERFATVIQQQMPDAKVGCDGFLGYHVKSGYDFRALTRNLRLNQTYVSQPLQGELVRSFKQPGAFTGRWGNAIADSEDGFRAWVWDTLFRGDQAAWWWTSWGCDYIPFNPDGSLNPFGRAFFEVVNEAKAGAGRLLLNARREDSGIGILYDHRNLLAAELAGQLVQQPAFSGDAAYVQTLTSLARAIRDEGCEYHFVAADQVEGGQLSPEREAVLFVPLATCLSDAAADGLRRYVEAGGSLVIDGRAGLLDERGSIRAVRPLDELCGVRSPTGAAAMAADAWRGEVDWNAAVKAPATVLEPGVEVTNGQAGADFGGHPVRIQRQVGQGRAMLLNLAWRDVAGERHSDGPKPLTALLQELLSEAGRQPFAKVEAPDGGRLTAVHQSLWTDGPVQYLAVRQDLLDRGLAPQPCRITLDHPAVVYDMRSGKRIGEGQTTTWTAEIRRGNDLLYAVLPYTVDGLNVSSALRGDATASLVVDLRLQTSSTPGRHAVRVDVYAPGSNVPHREYSQTATLVDGQGRLDIPWALNDPTGIWRIVARDAASGVRAQASVER